MLQTGHASIFFLIQTIFFPVFFILNVIFSSLAHLDTGMQTQRCDLFTCDPLPPTAKQIGDASTTAARGSSEHNQENYLAQLQVVHRTDKQLPTTFFCSTSLIMLQTLLGNHILLLQYDSSPLLTTHFLIKGMNAIFICFIAERSRCGCSEDPQSAQKMLCPPAAETRFRHQDPLCL